MQINLFVPYFFLLLLDIFNTLLYIKNCWVVLHPGGWWGGAPPSGVVLHPGGWWGGAPPSGVVLLLVGCCILVAGGVVLLLVGWCSSWWGGAPPSGVVLLLVGWCSSCWVVEAASYCQPIPGRRAGGSRFRAAGVSRLNEGSRVFLKVWISLIINYLSSPLGR